MADVYDALSDQLERLGKSALTIKAERDHLRIAIDLAVNLGLDYGTGDGAHHKMWVIDQMIRILAGDRYEQTIKEACAGEDGPDSYEWDCGIAP